MAFCHADVSLGRYPTSKTETQMTHDSQSGGWYRELACRLDDFVKVLAEGDVGTTRYAADFVERIPVYHCPDLAGVLSDDVQRSRLQAEWARVLREGAGVFILRRAFADRRCIDEATRVFEIIIRSEKAQGSKGGDHFARAGANDRIWNAQEKLCLAAPEVFAEYFSNQMLMAAAEAWLGPCYQMTSQVNVVQPGGMAQQAHRDYHLGFQTAQGAERFPAHVHGMSALLTLQGAVAHSDMPVESGPTKLLPFSQRYAAGYVAWRRAEFRDYFERHYVQAPLAKGDAIFFNPALYHAAGSNVTPDVHRTANLLQISSAFGRAMETLDRTRMCEAIYPVLRERLRDGRMLSADVDAAIAACAEGYPFPTNLDRDPPLGGLAPQSQSDLMQAALQDDCEPVEFSRRLKEHAWKRSA
jgi:ectoine hydroxylase-related dioxygenase (phytanoyl-CoA dioxygenase family)